MSDCACWRCGASASAVCHWRKWRSANGATCHRISGFDAIGECAAAAIRSGRNVRGRHRLHAVQRSKAKQTFKLTWTAVERIHECQRRSEEHTSELQSLMRISYAVFCL